MSYRKPLLPHTAFPAPLLDVLAGYLHLLALGFEPRNITVLGKSAGGHLSLMLLRYIAELQLPTPGGLGMMAPWCDLTMSFPSYSRHNDFDTLCHRKLAIAVRSAMRWYTPQAMDEAYFTPAKAGARAWTWLGKGGVRVYIMFGTREMLEDEIRQMVGDMKAAGAEVRVREVSLSSSRRCSGFWGGEMRRYWCRDGIVLLRLEGPSAGLSRRSCSTYASQSASLTTSGSPGVWPTEPRQILHRAIARAWTIRRRNHDRRAPR